MSGADKSCLPAVRREIENALDHLHAARAKLIRRGWPETAAMLDRSIAHVATWTNGDGICDHLERDPIPVREAAE
jgi:hypothetical protein